MPRGAAKKAKQVKTEAIEADNILIPAGKLSNNELERLKDSNPDAYIRGKLEKEQKVRIMIPREQGFPKGYEHTFQINGVKFSYPMGEMIDVPESIAEMINARWYEANNNADGLLVKRSRDVQDALS